MESFHDYTLATPWERFVAVIEQNFRSWLLTGLDALPKTKLGSKPTTHKIQAKLNHKLPWRREPYLLTLYVPPLDAGPTSLRRGQSMRTSEPTSAADGAVGSHSGRGASGKAQDDVALRAGQHAVAPSTAAASPLLPPLFPAAAAGRGSAAGADVAGVLGTSDVAGAGATPLESLQSEDVFVDVDEGMDELDPADMDQLLSDLRNTDMQLHLVSPRESIMDTESVAVSEAPPVADDVNAASVSDDDAADEDPAPLTTVPIHITDERSAREARSKASQGSGIMKESRSWWPLRGRPRQWWRYGKQHRLQTWFGVDIFLLLEPASYSGRILDEKEANALLSALAVALQNTAISWPAFIPVHDALRDTFWGTASTCFGPVRFDTDSIHTSRTPPRLMGLEGQLSLFAAQLRPYSPGASLYCQALANPYALDCPSQQYEPCSVTLTCRQVHVLPTTGTDEEDSAEEESSWSSRWDDLASWRPWASQKDPINVIELDVAWEGVELQLGSQRPQLHPADAHHWKLHVLQCGISTPHKNKGFMPKSIDRYRQHVQLQREGADWLWSAGNASFYFHNSLISERQQQVTENGMDVGLSSFTAMLHALLSARGAASRAGSMGEMVHAEWWEQRNAVVPPAPPERVMEDVLRDLFTPANVPTLFKRDQPPSSLKLDFPGTAPQDCLLSCLAKHCLVFGNARAIAMLWSRFTQEVRFEHWDAVTLLPRLPSRLVRPTQPPHPPTLNPSPHPEPHTPTKLTPKLLSIHPREQLPQGTPLSHKDSPARAHFTPSPHTLAATSTPPHTSTPLAPPAGVPPSSSRPSFELRTPVDVRTPVRRTSSTEAAVGAGRRTAWNLTALEELKCELAGGDLGFARSGVMGGPPEPDLNTCLLHQKLQLLNVCIFRRNGRRCSQAASLSPPPVGVEKDSFTSRQDVSSTQGEQGKDTDGWDFDSDDEFADAAPGNSVTSSSLAGSEYESCSDDDGTSPSLRQAPSSPALCRVAAPHAPIRAPDTQEPPCLTADMLLAKQRLLSALTDDTAGGQHLLLRLKAELLISDIASFKDANPDCDLQDFISWQQAVWAQVNNTHHGQSSPHLTTGPATHKHPPTSAPSPATCTLPPIRPPAMPSHPNATPTPNPSIDASPSAVHHQADGTHTADTPSKAVQQQLDNPQGVGTSNESAVHHQASDVQPASTANEVAAQHDQTDNPQGASALNEDAGLGSTGLLTTTPAGKHKFSSVPAPLLHLWESTPACAADNQKSLLDVEREAEIVLHYLETVPPVSLFNQLFVVGVACAVGLLSQCKGAQLEVCRRKLEQFASIMAPILEKGSGLAEALEELERNGTTGGEGVRGARRGESGRPRGLDDAELEFVLAEFQVLEQVVVLAESLTRRLPSCPSVCNRILQRMVEGSDEGEREPEGRFWSGCDIVSEHERELIWKLLSKGTKRQRSAPGWSSSPTWGASESSDSSWAHPSQAAESTGHPHVAQREWVLECIMEHPRRCRPQRPVAQFDASGAHPPRCKHRLYVQEADSEMRLATLFTNHGP